MKDFLGFYIFIADHDQFILPRNYKERKLTCPCAYFNHSCESNCEYRKFQNGFLTIAIRDIQPGIKLF
jgi:SET domain-containing protein